MPSDIKKEFKKELFAVFEKYQHASYQLLNQFNRESYLQADAIPLEKEATKQIVELKERIIRQFKFMHYIKTPFQSLRKFVASSHLGLFIYQSTFKGNISMEIVRWLSFSFLFLLLFASFLVLFIPKLNSPIKTLLLGAFAYLFYLIFFQRLNEERYYYVLFPLFFVGSITLLRHLSQRKKRS